MIAYLIKLTLCSGLLLAVYYLLLEKEKMHRFNRFYLLSAVIFSFIIPLISVRVGTITVTDNPYPVLFETQPSQVTDESPAITTDVTTPVATQSSDDYLSHALLVIYCLVTLVLLFRLTGTIVRIWIKTANALEMRYKNAKLVLLKDKTATHTFLNTIFVSHNDYNGNKVNEEILTHEWTHVRQKHSLDVLFIELVKSIVWFNPFFILYKRAIQLNHEFLADDAVVHAYNDVFAYQHLLLDKISLTSSHNLSSRLNFLITKKRLAMMTQEKNNKRATIKTIIVAVLLTGAFFLFVEKTYAQVKNNNTQAKKDSTLLDAVPFVIDSITGQVSSVKVMGKNEVLGFTTPPRIKYFRGKIHGDGISQEQFDDYQKAVNSAYQIKTAPDGTQYFSIDVTGLDIKHLLSVYQRMSREQQWNAILLPGRIPYYPPPAKNPPTAEQFKQWSDPKYAGVWIGSKRIANSDLGTKYKPSDFALWDQSLLGKGAYNYGKHKYQVNLYTHEDYAKSYPETVIHTNSVKQEGNTIILK